MNQNLKTTFILVIALLVIGYIAWFFSWILIYLVISAVFALILAPLKKSIEKIRIGKFKIPSWLNAVICIAFLYSLFVAFFSIFIPLVLNQAYTLSNINTLKVIKNFEEPLKYIEQFMIKYKIAENPTQMAQEYLNEKMSQLFEIGNLGYLLSYFVGFTGNLFIAIFSITFITFFFVKNEKLPKQIILGLVPQKYIPKANRVLIKAEKLLSRYFIGLIFQITGITLVAYIGLSVIGVKNALLIGFFAGVVNIVPYLGPIMGALFGAIVAISTNLEANLVGELLPLIFKIFLVFAIVQVIDNMIFQPVIFSSSVKAHPLEIFLIVLIGGRLAGIAGMIVAIPTYTFIRIVAKEFLNQFRVVKKLTYQL